MQERYTLILYHANYENTLCVLWCHKKVEVLPVRNKSYYKMRMAINHHIYAR